MLNLPRTIAAAICLVFTSSAQAQLGPRPNEIPATEREAQPQPESQAQPAETGSSSALVRPAIDDLLLSRARGSDTASTSQPLITQLQDAPIEKESVLASPSTLQTSQSKPAEEKQSLGDSIGLPTLTDGWGQTIIALGGVLLLIFGIAQFYKRLARTQGGLAGKIGAGGSAPSGILEVIGRYPISTGLTLVVLKFDRRVLLVSSSAGTRGKHARNAAMQTLCELTDPEDVASILLKSRSASGESIASSFERALQDADDFTDDSIYRYDEQLSASAPVQSRAPRQAPPRTIATDEGDRAELWSTQNDGKVAAQVLRQRLAAMRSGARPV
jgi:hypothetical protein